MAFADPTLGGQNNLIRDQIKSPNYVAGSTGWIISKNGTAEFSDITVRGTVIATGNNGSYIKLSPASPVPKIEIRGQNSTDVAVIEPATGGGIEIVGPTSGGAPAATILIKGPNTVFQPNSITLDVTGGSEKIYLSTTAGVSVSADIVNSTDSMTYFRGQRWVQNISFAAAASNTQVVNFPVAYPAGVTPSVLVTIAGIPGSANKANISVSSITNTGFTLWTRSTDGTNLTWTGVPVQIVAIV